MKTTSILNQLLVATLCFATVPALAATGMSRYNEAVELYNAGKWEETITIVDETQKATLPGDTRARYLLIGALAHEKGNNADQARQLYQKLLKEYPKAPEAITARIGLIYLDYSYGRIDEVIKNYEALDLGSLPKKEQRALSFVYAKSLRSGGQAKKALDAYQLTRLMGTPHRDVARHLLDVYLELGMHTEALDLTTQGVPDMPTDLVALVRTEATLAREQWSSVLTESGKMPAESRYAPGQHSRKHLP